MKCSRSFFMVKSKPSPQICIIISAVCVIVTAVMSVCLGAVSVSAGDIISAICGERSSVAARIIIYVRLPRTAASLFAGAGLAGAGMIIQSLLHNPLAGPNIIGVNAGAGFCAALFCAVFPASPQLLPFGAFFGALAAVLIVYTIAKKTSGSKITIVLAGVAVNSFLNAGTDTIHTFFPDAVIGSNSFRIGGLASLQIKTLIPAFIMIGTALLAAFLMRNELDILSLGDETAKSLGLSVKTFRFILLAVAACLAGAAVSFAGLLGFVGLITPHAARFIVGSETRYLLPLSVAMGAAMLTLCDVIARLLFAPYELPVGIILAFLGAPFFIFLLIHSHGGNGND